MKRTRLACDNFAPLLLAGLLSLSPSHPARAQVDLVGAAEATDGFDAQIAEAEQEMRDDPSAGNCRQLAELLLSANRKMRAKAVLEDGRKKFPEVPFLTHALAVVLGQIGLNEEAFVMFGQALQSYGGAGSPWANAAFYFGYGAAAHQAGHRERAEEFLQKAIALAPEASGAPANYLGYLWADRGERLEEAEQLIRRALEQEPDSAAYLDSLGWVFFKRGEHDQALAQLLKAAAAGNPPDAEILDHLGDVYVALHRPAEALEAWRKAQTVELGNEIRERKIRELQAKTDPGAKPAPP